jgi:hypothetical protein
MSNYSEKPGKTGMPRRFFFGNVRASSRRARRKAEADSPAMRYGELTSLSGD